MSRAALESSGEQGILNGAAGQPAAASQRISALRLFLRAIGISFISVLSVLIAFFAFTTLPQVQDVLLDARPYWVQEALFWSFFYLVGYPRLGVAARLCSTPAAASAFRLNWHRYRGEI